MKTKELKTLQHGLAGLQFGIQKGICVKKLKRWRFVES